MASARFSHPRPLFAALAIALAAMVAPTRAQDPPEPTTIAAQDGDAALRAVIESLAANAARAQELNERLSNASTPEARASIAQDLAIAESRRVELELNLDSLASGIDSRTISGEATPKRTLLDQLEALLRPAIQRLEEATAEPRRLEELNALAVEHEERAELFQRGLARMRQRVENLEPDDEIRGPIAARAEEWQRRLADERRRASIARGQFRNLDSSRRPFVETARAGLEEFFVGRGLNLLLAALVLALVFLGARAVYLPVERTLLQRHGERPFYLRVLSAIVHVLAGGLAVTGALVVLWIRGDWLLLGIAIFIVLGTAFVGRQAIPRYFAEIRLLLNLGTVRERERLVYQGIPWLVETLSVRSRLVNPALAGGVLRLPLGRLAGMQSRAASLEEPYFPCRAGDYVVLADGTRGEIAMQTPEQVCVELLGGARKTYPTAAFLLENPANFAHGFLIEVSFGIDYGHQTIATEEIPRAMESALHTALATMVGAGGIVTLEVEFRAAASSSLDLMVTAAFTGAVAPRSLTVERRIHRVMVEECSRRGWVIPFPQVRIHRSGSD